MIKSVIFDWIGTLYEKNIGPFPDSEETLVALKERAIRMSLISLTKDSNRRKLEIENSGLAKYFDHLVINEEKTASQYLMCIHLTNSDNKSTLVVDDRTIRGIKIGNELRCPTAWIQRGEYAHELPNKETGEPTYTIKTVRDILSILN